MNNKTNETEKRTCSVAEFAAIVGISRDRAYELCKSECPPPYIKSGKAYRIIVSRIDAYIDKLSDWEYEKARSHKRYF